MNRDQKQQEVVDGWFKKNQWGVMILSTGFGKCKVAIDVIKRLRSETSDDLKILILVNSQTLRDKNWHSEFNNWHLDTKNVTLECFQKMYKVSGQEFDLVISDEFDFSLTPNYMNFYRNNKIKYFLGLTGFIPENKLEYCSSIAPIICRYDLSNAQEEGVLNKSSLVYCSYLLDSDKNIKVEYKDKKSGDAKFFYTSETEQYNFWDSKVKSLFRKQMQLKGVLKSKGKLEPSQYKELVKLPKQIMNASIKRGNILASSASSIKRTKEIVQRILDKDLKNKVIVFCKYTKDAKQVCENFVDKSNIDSLLDKFSKGEIRAISTCKMIDRGVNVKGANHIVLQSYTSSQTDFFQRHGRGCRLPQDQMLYFSVMMPYIMDSEGTILNTKAWDWSQAMLRGYKPSKTYNL